MRSKIGGRGTRGVRKMVAAGCVAAGLVLATVASAQAPAVTAGDYARAEKFLAHNTAPLVDHVPAMLDWIDDDQFTWRDHDAGADSFLSVDAAHGGVVPAFDHGKLARALGHAAGKPVQADNLTLKTGSIANQGRIHMTAHNNN